jgi:mono/diheme cytochrome c family protein
MKAAIKIGIGMFGFVILGTLIMLFIVYTFLPSVGTKKEISINVDSAMIDRGQYLVENVTNCFHCHSENNEQVFSSPVIESRKGAGGRLFGKDQGFPGSFYAANLTPHFLSDWTDSDLYHTITTGVSKDGRPLFPMMPYKDYGKMTEYDVKSIIAYLRTIPSINKEVPKSEPSFPMSLIMRMIPSEAEPMENPKTEIEKGKYLAYIAGCRTCHTPSVKGRPQYDLEFSGGMQFILPTQDTVRSPNITSDLNTGIGRWTEEMFVNRFKSYKDLNNLPSIKKGSYNTEMPWAAYANMRDEDLRAIYKYLKTVKPQTNSVHVFSPLR